MGLGSALRSRTATIAVPLLLIASAGLPAIVSLGSPAGTERSGGIASPSVEPPATAPAAASSGSPHPGTLEVYDTSPGGATTEDPAVAYDTVSYEPILNVYETLVTFNGASSNGLGPNAFVPVLATCVPGTAECVTDYGTDLIANNTTGVPTYWTFVIDPAARFYDPATNVSWGVYPTDVMFSIARQMAYSEAIGAGNTPGWLVAQALLPNGSAKWDGGLHAPYNTTPESILGSMFVNDTRYCPSAAMTNAHGCITFNASGGGLGWPGFLQLIGDGFMGTVPCGWYTYEAAGLPGWPGTTAANGDGSCALPDGGTSTQNATWTSYLAGLSPTAWDSFEQDLAARYPAPAPAVQWHLVGSGPYYATVSPNGSTPGYSLTASPAYAEPSGCSGAGGLAAYGGYCWPAPGSYDAHVLVYYEDSGAPGLAAARSGAADFVNGPALNSLYLAEAEALSTVGKLDVYSAPSMTSFFDPIDLNWSSSAYRESGLPNASIPDDFFSGMAARGLLTHAYEYATTAEQVLTNGTLTLESEAGGPIAAGMDYYPTNVSYPYLEGNPTQPASTAGSAAWWWQVGTTVGSGYYDPQLAACLNTTCTFPIVGTEGDPISAAEVNDFVDGIEAVTDGHVQPFAVTIEFCTGICPLLAPPASVPAIASSCTVAFSDCFPVWSLGWAPDNYLPQDYLLPLVVPNSTFPYYDSVSEQLTLPAYNDPAVCGHSAATQADLIFWARAAELNSSCEGVAYEVAVALLPTAQQTSNGTTAGVLYWAIQSILNDLALYVFTGQANETVMAAPWIAGSSINLSPLVGGGGDQYWFQIRTVAYETPVTFSQTGLPSGLGWTISGGSPATAKGNATGGSITFEVPNGTLGFSISSPYGTVVSVTGGTETSLSSTFVTGRGPENLTVTFSPRTVLEFVETGLANGTQWGVTLTQTFKGSTATLTNSSSGPTILFPVQNHSAWKYAVTTVTGYKFSAKGSVRVNGATTRGVRFKELFVGVTFSERGLKRGTTWSVTVTAADGKQYGFNGTKSSVRFELPFGPYTFSVGGVSGYTVTPTAGNLTIASTHAIKEKLLFIPSAAPVVGGPAGLHLGRPLD